MNTSYLYSKVALQVFSVKKTLTEKLDTEGHRHIETPLPASFSEVLIAEQHKQNAQL